MKKRIISLILAISFLFSLIPAVRAEEKAAQPDIEAMVAEQFDAFATSLKPGSASDGPFELVLHSIAGSRDLHLDKDDDLTKALLNSQVLRSSFIDTAVSLCKSAGAVFGSETAYMTGNLYWYENERGYRIRACEDNGNKDLTDDSLRVPGLYVEQLYDLELNNSYDEAMLLVVGHANSRFIFRPQRITDTTISYRVTITIADVFDFNNSEYYGDDQDLEKFLTWLGGILALGMLNTFEWTATVEFDLEMPNLCSHTSHNYAWEYNGTGDLVNVSGEEFSENNLTKLKGHVDADGEFQETWYAATVPMLLRHDLPWTLEFRCKGTGDFLLSEVHVAHTGTYLRRNRNTLLFTTWHHITSDEFITMQYGKNYAQTTGFVAQDYHTFTLTNHVNSDGSNVVWLYVDGVDLGDMDRHYQDGVFQGTATDWFNGRDFGYAFIGSHSYPLKNVMVDFIRVWENGKDGEAVSFLTTSSAEPTCTADGGTLNTCSQCGAEFLTDVIPAYGHDFDDWKTVKEPTCAAEGRMERSCRTCGHIDSKPIPALPHTYTTTVTAPTCTEQGYTTYSCFCGYSEQADFTDALGHDLTEWTRTGEFSCTDGGSEERHCLLCDHQETRQLPPTGHSYEATIVEPGCTEVGYTFYICSGCGDSYKTNYTNPTGHSHEAVVTAPTCTEGGFTTYTCACGDSYVSNYTAALGHDYAGGICTRCGDGQSTFTDVPEGSFYYDPVLWAVENGITSGTSATTFSPDSACLRAQVVTFLWRAAGQPEPTSTENPFEDVKPIDFYYKAVLWAVENGITTGIDAFHFNPMGICNRAQVVTFLYRALSSPAVENADNPFSDVPAGQWYTAPVLWAVENGITNGLSPDSFGPTADCNRAQIVTFLHRAYN